MTSPSLPMLALAALLLAGCGKTDSSMVAVREDPRTGPVRMLPGFGPDFPDLDVARKSAVYPRWDPPNAAHGFAPVPHVDRHPPMDHP